MKDKKMLFRISLVVGFFVLVCFVYLIRMINIVATADESDRIVTGTYERRVNLQALRGEILDRNGNKLVCNQYSYNMIFDYDAMAATHLDRNYAILQAVYALQTTGNTEHRTDSSFPFAGSYPDYTYTEEAKDGQSNIYYRLLRRIAQNELETEAGVPKNELTVTLLDDFYKTSPDAFPKEQEIMDWFMDRYDLNSKNSTGEPLFTDREIDIIMRVRYDMEVADFSIFTPYVFATDLDVSFISYIKELNVVGADFRVETERRYVYPGYASHILGNMGAITSENWEYYQALGYEMDDTVGVSGCEYAFESYLRGVDGVMVIVEDKQGNIIDSRIEKEPVPGKDVYLTIDIQLQIAAEDALAENVDMIGDAKAGAATAVDPDSGEILVLASYPTYDLTTYREIYNELAADKRQPLLNRVLIGEYTPGSTFKVGMVAAGISSGTVNSATTLRCDGVYTYYDGYHPTCLGVHGNVNAAYSLQVSCNCYFYELGRLMGLDLINEYAAAYGLGQPTGIELYETVGCLATKEPIQAAIGQSDNKFTPLQVANYIATITNGGTRYALHLLKEVREYGVSQSPVYEKTPQVLGKVDLTSDALYGVRQGMKQMIEDSAVAKRFMQGVPVTVGGKTGTAQRGEGRNDNRLFVAAAPYDDPEIVISVVIEPDDTQPMDTYHGSSYASYTASKILKAYYN